MFACISSAPVLVELGRRWARENFGTTVEHFAIGADTRAARWTFPQRGDSGSGPLVLVGCAPGELHELGALMLALFLRRAGIRVAYLGPNIEVEGLLATMASLRPACVLLSAALAPQAEALALLAERLKVDQWPDGAVLRRSGLSRGSSCSGADSWILSGIGCLCGGRRDKEKIVYLMLTSTRPTGATDPRQNQRDATIRTSSLIASPSMAGWAWSSIFWPGPHPGYV